MGVVPEIGIRHRIRIAREYADLEQAELAAATGIARSTISNLEKGSTSRIKPLYVSLIAAACGVDAGWLATGEAGSNVPGPGLRLLPQEDSNFQPFDYRFRRAEDFSAAA